MSSDHCTIAGPSVGSGDVEIDPLIGVSREYPLSSDQNRRVKFFFLDSGELSRSLLLDFDSDLLCWISTPISSLSRQTKAIFIMIRLVFSQLNKYLFILNHF
jgi:hypothetical protein